MFMEVYNSQIEKLLDELRNARTPAELLNAAKKQVVLMNELTTGGVKTYDEIRTDVKKELSKELVDQCTPYPSVGSESKTDIRWITLLILILCGTVLTLFVIFKYSKTRR